jgi:hypothetical protein
MKKLSIIALFLWLIFVAWCDQSHNFMDVDNPHAKEDLMNLIWTWNIPNINTDNIIPDSLSWTREDVKWFANKQMEGTLGEYVDKAKDGLSWAKETVKWFYNDSVDDLNQMISEKVNWVISWELNKFKIK